MEVKLVITPSEEMVALVDKVINAFSGLNAATKKATAAVEDFKETESIIEEKIEEVKAVQMQPESVKKRRTKAEIEVEKLAQQEPIAGMEDFGVQTEGQQGNSTGTATEQIVEEVELGFVPSVVKLRKMTVNRSEKIDDVPAKLMEFGYSSVTALAKDEDAAKRYYVYLIGVSPLTGADDE
jgi:hypothetical protein